MTIKSSNNITHFYSLFGSLTFMCIAVSACSVNMKNSPPLISDYFKNSSPAPSAFSLSWTFDSNAPTSSYLYDPLKINFTAGVCSLIGTNQSDASSACTGFGDGVTSLCGGIYKGVTWDAANSTVRLSQTGTPTNTADLDASWTPQYANIVGYWKFNGSGTVADGVTIPATIGENLTAHNVNGSGLSYVQGLFSQGLQFDGVDDYLTLPAITAAKTSYPTISFWLKVNSAPGCGPSVLSFGGPYNNTGFCGLSIQTESQGTLLPQQKTAPYAVNLNQWINYVFTYDGSFQKIYINGNLFTSIAYAGGPLAYDSSASEIMKRYGSYLAGTLDEFSIWSTPLSAADIQKIYNRQSAKYSGSFTSRVMDALQTGMSWTTLSWKTTLPFFKALPDYASGAVQNETSSDYSSLVGSTGATTDNNLLSGIVGLWHLDEPNGTSGASSVKDFSGQAVHCTPSGLLTLGATGKLGTGANYDGTTGRLTCGSAVTTSSSITTAGWVYENSRASNADPAYAHPIFQNDVSPGYNMLSSNNGVLTIVNGNSFYVTSYTLPLKTWTHFAVRLSAGNNLKLYINGVEVDSVATGSSLVAMTPISLGRWGTSFDGAIDEVGIWSRALQPQEILQLYRRGANRVKHQVRTCSSADCSDDLVGANWKGPDGTNQTYFSELNNNTVPLAMTGTVNKAPPSMLFSNFTGFSAFTSPITSAPRYFQYRTILESDDTSTGCTYDNGSGPVPTWCSPELKSVTVDPVHYDSSGQTVVGKIGVRFVSLSSFLEKLGSSCTSSVGYNLGLGAVYNTATWYYWNGTAWTVANGAATQSNNASVISANAASFGTQLGNGTVYFKAYLKSDGISKCELNQLNIGGLQ